MSHNRIAILIDGGFFLKRLSRVITHENRRDTPEKVAGLIRILCRSHVCHFTKCDRNDWTQHVYRTFFYDATPYDKQAHHPIQNRQIDFSKSKEALFRTSLFDELRKSRKMALRLGKVIREGDWSPPATKVRKILPTQKLLSQIDLGEAKETGKVSLNAQQIDLLEMMQRRWADIDEHEILLRLKQKGVDMRIGVDIASIALKRQADTIVLVAGDSDFVPAAKLARREGVDFILDPMWQGVNDDLYEHIDGLHSGLRKPRRSELEPIK